MIYDGILRITYKYFKEFLTDDILVVSFIKILTM